MKKADFFRNIGGQNTADSPFYVDDTQATGGANYEYLKTGGITKRRGHMRLNASADADLRTLGMGTHAPKDGSKTAIRASDAHLKSIFLDTGALTTVSEDTATPNSVFFTAGSVQPVVFTSYNTAFADTTWMAGGGASTLYAYTGTQMTKNGSEAPIGTFSGVVSLTGGSWNTAGTYFYALVQRKASTKAQSNAALDFSATIVNTTDKVTITLPATDTTKYDQFLIYRSAVSGTAIFTTGDLIAQIPTTTPTFVDTGASIGLPDNIPRSGNPILDNGTLPAGTYKSVVVWKNQLVTCKGNTLYISDIEKPESWPLQKNYTIAGIGEITALGVLNFNSRSTANTDEYLCIWSDRKMWMIQGEGIFDTNLSTWDVTIRFLDNVGCTGQATVVNAYGSILWMDTSGIYQWDANGKPMYISRLIEDIFGPDGDIDKSHLSQAWAVFFRKQKQIHFFYPHRTQGINTQALVLDGRLTFMNIGSGDGGTVTDSGIFAQNTTSVGIFGGTTILTALGDEYLLLGDGYGFVYNALRGGKEDVPTAVDPTGDVGVNFDYFTRWLDMGSPGMAKQFGKVVVYVEAMTPDNLTLEYWADYKSRDLSKSTRQLPMSVKGDRSVALWDVAFWNEALWDDYKPQLVPISFNLDSTANNNQGDALRLHFKQGDESVPVVILGFSVYYSEISARK